MRSRVLTQRSYREGLAELVSRDPDIACIVERIGVPPWTVRSAAFSSLLYIILEQQVSLASAKATYEKLTARLPSLSPQDVLAVPDALYRELGVSRQKTRYLKLAAQAVLDDSLPLGRLDKMSDDQARSLMTQVKGIGDWTADVFLMSALKRADLWPIGDLALVKSIIDVKGLDQQPDKTRLEALGEPYRPFRSIATRVYWHHYLNPE
ncbi:MAG: DNA-3-methyladenine glycosylase 2 family protein [Pseudomonadota bacterium]